MSWFFQAQSVLVPDPGRTNNNVIFSFYVMCRNAQSEFIIEVYISRNKGSVVYIVRSTCSGMLSFIDLRQVQLCRNS